MVFDGGIRGRCSALSNLTIETRRFDWFWWGDGDPLHFNIKRRSEIDGTKARQWEPAAGKILQREHSECDCRTAPSASVIPTAIPQAGWRR